jgi:hypothetical protein
MTELEQIQVHYESLHDELFNSILSEYGYTSFAELSIWAQEPTN